MENFTLVGKGSEKMIGSAFIKTQLANREVAATTTATTTTTPMVMVMGVLLVFN